jgi:hypothetical protein
VFLKQLQCAIQGDWRAGEKLVDCHERHSAAEDQSEHELPEEDADLLKRAMAARSRRRATTKAGAVAPPDREDEDEEDGDVR